MATQKLYAGTKLREIRTRMALTQKDFAAKLGVSRQSAQRLVSLAVDRGSAAGELGIATGDEVVVAAFDEEAPAAGRAVSVSLKEKP